MSPAPSVRPGERSRRARLLAAWAAPSLAAPILIGTAFPDAGAVSPDGDGVVQPEAAPSESEFFTDLDAGSHTITLITGDRVTINVSDGGLTSVDVEHAPRPDGSIPDINIPLTGGEGLYAYPEDVWPFIDAGLLDEELFNIEYLAANGYADEDSDQLPVIVEYADQVGTASATRNAERMPASKRTVTLESINAAGVTVDKDDTEVFWESLTSEQPADELSSQTAKLPAGIEKVWLDRKAEVVLDESVPQIGVPDAWDAGFDGAGVTVAVLDTGIDADHPDVAGKVVAAQSFVGDAEPVDGHGHGTHVASTVAGAGAASEGQYTGVAPGAELVIGKVCDDGGSCPNSSVIEGMEWAALERGADVVSMSLGGCCTDGTDPLSQAVNQLTDATGALFVIAAGNNGPSIASPGTAASALTVGAVDKSDELAGFSNRGPVLGSFALKPEITAPGVSIVAARAAGTSMGTPVDDHYTSANGTSMATPHVAGAAALLVQQHPEWGAAELKAGLVAAAEDGGYTVYEQGAGRVDVARAVSQQVQVSPATADFRLIPFDQEEPPDPQTLTYTNPTGEPVTLDLVADARSVSGDPADGVLTIEPDTLTVASGGTATVTVALDHTMLDRGSYTGSVVATSAEGTRLTTPVGFSVEAERFPVRIQITHSEDQYAFSPGPSGVSVGIAAIDGAEYYESIMLTKWTDPPFTADVMLPAGTYDITAANAQWNDLTTGQRQSATLIAPEVVVPDEREVVLDATTAQRITFDTPEPYGAEGVRGETSLVQKYERLGPDPDAGLGFLRFSAEPQLWVTPTEPVTTGELRYSVHTFFAAPPVTMDALGPDGRRLHTVHAEKWPPRVPRGPGEMFNGTQTLPLVDAGTATPAELDGLDLNGKLVMLNRNPSDPPDGGGVTACWPLQESLDRITERNPAGVILVQNEHAVPPFDPGTQNGCNTPYTHGYEISVPLVFAPFADAQYLRDLRATSNVRIRVRGTPVTPYIYDLKPYWEGRIPDSVALTFTDNDLATFDHDFHASHLTPGNGILELVGYARRGDETTTIGGLRTVSSWHQLFEAAPWEITHYIGPLDSDVMWRHNVAIGPWSLPGGTAGSQATHSIVDTPNRTPASWYDSPPVPSPRPAPRGQQLCAGCRLGDGFWPAFFYSTSSDPAMASEFAVGGEFPDPDVHLYRDGHEIPQTPDPYGFGFLAYELPAERGRYGLTHRLAGTETAWEFSSESVLHDEMTAVYRCFGNVVEEFLGTPLTPCRAEPLIFLRYDLGLDLSNRAEAPGSHAFEVTAYRQPSTAEMPDIAGLDLWVSYDGGDEWREARVRPLADGRFEVRVVHPPAHRRASDTVSIRAEGWDVDGNRVEQTITDAFRLTDGAPQGGGKHASGGGDLVS